MPARKRKRGARPIVGQSPTPPHISATRGLASSSSAAAPRSDARDRFVDTRPSRGHQSHERTRPTKKRRHDQPSSQKTVSEMLRGIDPQKLDEVLKETKAPAKEEEFIRDVGFLSPKDPERVKTITRFLKVDTAAAASFTYASVLDDVGLPYFCLPMQAFRGIEGTGVRPIGVAYLPWYDMTNIETMWNTRFFVLSDPEGKRDFDFLLGADWLRLAQVDLNIPRHVNVDGTAIPSSMATAFLIAPNI